MPKKIQLQRATKSMLIVERDAARLLKLGQVTRFAVARDVLPE